MMKHSRSLIYVLVALLMANLRFLFPNATAEEEFDVRRHLSTVTGYSAARNVNEGSSATNSVPRGCSPVHINLVARHGTRSPTKKRIKELDRLTVRLDRLLSERERTAEINGLSLQSVPSWLRGWQSPWQGRQKGGELVERGEKELYNLGIRIREKYPELFSEEYHPDTFNIRATQVPRASASAVAFGMGLFSGKGNLGPGSHRAFSVISESRASDIWLRFYESCKTYNDYRKSQEPAVNELKQPILKEITSSLSHRYGLNFTVDDIASLWFLCKQEASLLDITDQACGLFNPEEVSFLEWTDDLEVFILKGYGKALNYRMGVPLLQDVVQSMEETILAIKENRMTYEKARLRFAHAETVVPFTCLLGLFLEGSEFEKIQREEPLDLPPKPPQKRKWMGSALAPFSGNNMLILYSCPSATGNNGNDYFVHVLHNEVPISMPACGDSDFCPFEVFKEKVVTPHLRHDFNLVCGTGSPSFSPMSTSKPVTFTRKLALFFRWLLFLDGPGVSAGRSDEL
ncbi:histidine acid phosphatase family protein [Wolffia australiana]